MLFALSVTISDLGDINLIWVAIVIAVIVILAPVVHIMQINRSVKKDEQCPSRMITGRVIEKNVETVGGSFSGVKVHTEWITFEDNKGIRFRFRNAKMQYIHLEPGDEGVLEVRGESIYDFKRKN